MTATLRATADQSSQCNTTIMAALAVVKAVDISVNDKSGNAWHITYNKAANNPDAEPLIAMRLEDTTESHCVVLWRDKLWIVTLLDWHDLIGHSLRDVPVTLGVSGRGVGK